MSESPNGSYRLFTEENIKDIHKASLVVLEKTGVVMEHPGAIEIMSSAGCKVSDKKRVHVPGDLVEEAIKKTPSSVIVYSRLGEPKLTLADRNVYYGTVTSLPFIADIDDTRRPYTLKDCKDMTVIMDYLDSLEFATATGNSADVPPAVSDVHEISCILENSPKPVLITTHDEDGLEAIIDICSVYKGDMDSFRGQPFVIYCICPISPLKFPASVLGKLILAVEHGFPFIIVPSPGAGGTSPITLAGTLVNGNAEILSGLVLIQTIKPGAAFLYGGFFSGMDMASMVLTHGSPEFNLLNVGQAELARYYGIPSFSSAGCTDSHEIDAQAAFECGFSTLVSGMCGANLVHAAGVLGSGTAVSKELLILNDECITFSRRFLRGVETTEKTLAVKEIDQIGPGGSFLQSDLTLDLFKKELWLPKCFIRKQYENWANQKTSLKVRLSQKCRNILGSHVPRPVEKDKLKEISKIIACSDRQRLDRK